MNSYLYQAVDDAGRLSQGLLQATDPMSIEAQLQQKGLWPISIEHQKNKNTSQSKGNKTRVSKARGHKARRAQIEFFTDDIKALFRFQMSELIFAPLS